MVKECYCCWFCAVKEEISCIGAETMGKCFMCDDETFWKVKDFEIERIGKQYIKFFEGVLGGGKH